MNPLSSSWARRSKVARETHLCDDFRFGEALRRTILRKLWTKKLITPSTQPDHPETKTGTPVWELALYYPCQGDWTESEFLWLDRERKIFAELNDGILELLPVPPLTHQRLMKMLLKTLEAYFDSRGAEVLFAPLPLRLRPGTMREPDLLVVSPEDFRTSKDYPDFAQLVVEVVSSSSQDRKRDFETKVSNYQDAGIPEYWIIDPEKKKVHVLSLEPSSQYSTRIYSVGHSAVSAKYPELSVNVTLLFELLSD